MKRKILLIEPNYKNKYPPMGLMKIATYYRNLGDEVIFFKGNLLDLVINDTFEKLLKQLYANDNTVFWEKYKPQICEYIRHGHSDCIENVPLIKENPIISELLKYYRRYFFNKKYFETENRIYDRVGITTLFTFYWDITIKTINFVKNLCKESDDPNRIMIGGVAASILPDKFEAATGIRPFVGTLSKPGILDSNDMIIDTLPLDYSILEEIDYEYPANNGYLAYMTRGCVNKCKFCAVPKLEPNYEAYLPIQEQIKTTDERFGGKKDLLLLDNNVLASCQFEKIIDEIKEAGFTKDNNFFTPNKYEIAIKNISEDFNTRGYIKAIVKEYRKLIPKLGDEAQKIYELLNKNYLLNDYTAKKDKILETYEQLKPFFENFYNKRPKKRIVDFNQGIDSRLITDSNMKKLFEIPIKPVRIAFDHWELRETYEKAVRTAVRAGHKSLSNYILYNYEDKPCDLYNRLKLNIDLCDELGISIYSFPMKYHPIEDPEYFSNRDYIGKYWNRKFIRTIQAILNSTKGKVGRGKSFFEEAFGSNLEEFEKLLYMPEALIIYRFHYKEKGITDKWWNLFSSLNNEELSIVKPIIESNKFNNYKEKISEPKLLELLKFYTINKTIPE